MNQVVYVSFGWLLGLLSQPIIEKIKRPRLVKDLKNGIRAELDELCFRMSGGVYLIESSLGMLNRDLLEWIKEAMNQDVNEIYFEKEGINRIDKLLKVPDANLKTMSLKKLEETESQNKGLSLKKHSLPFIDSNAIRLSYLERTLNIKVNALRAKLEQVNQEIDLARYYYERTFDSSMTPENYNIIRENVIQNQKQTSSLSRDFIGKARELSSFLS